MNELPDDEYRHMVQTLNKDQKEFFYHVLHLIKTSEEPFTVFLVVVQVLVNHMSLKPYIRLH